MSSSREIRLVEGDDGQWSAVDTDSGVASAGETRREALEKLDEAVALHDGSDGAVEGETTLLREFGIDPTDVTDARALPDFLQ